MGEGGLNPPDHFVAFLGSWSRRRTSLASEEHQSWGLSLTPMMTRKNPPDDLRHAMGVRHDAWVGFFPMLAESYGKMFWDANRNSYWSWCHEQGVNLVMALSATTAERHKTFTTYDEIRSHGLDAAIEWPLSDKDDPAMARFVDEHQIKDIVISRGVTFSRERHYQLRRLMRLKEIGQQVPSDCRIYIFGASNPTLVLQSVAHFSGHDIYLGGSRQWQDAGRYMIPPRQPVAKSKWSQEECYREALRRWRKWSTVIATNRKNRNGPNA